MVRSFVKEEAELAALDERIDRHRALSWANTRAATTLGALATMISGLGTVFVISYGVVLIGRGTISVGALLAFYALVSQLYAPIVRLTQFQATALATQVSVERLYEIFDEPEPVRDRPDAWTLSKPRGDLEFRDVHFAYSRPVRSAEERAEDARQADRKGAAFGTGFHDQSTERRELADRAGNAGGLAWPQRCREEHPAGTGPTALRFAGGDRRRG